MNESTFQPDFPDFLYSTIRILKASIANSPMCDLEPWGIKYIMKLIAAMEAHMNSLTTVPR